MVDLGGLDLASLFPDLDGLRRKLQILGIESGPEAINAWERLLAGHAAGHVPKKTLDDAEMRTNALNEELARTLMQDLRRIPPERRAELLAALDKKSPGDIESVYQIVPEARELIEEWRRDLAGEKGVMTQAQGATAIPALMTAAVTLLGRDHPLGKVVSSYFLAKTGAGLLEQLTQYLHLPPAVGAVLTKLEQSQQPGLSALFPEALRQSPGIAGPAVTYDATGGGLKTPSR